MKKLKSDKAGQPGRGTRPPWAVLGLAALLGFLGVPTGFVRGETNYVSISPSKGTAVTVVSSQSISTYYLCSQRQTLEYAVTGPVTVEITTRLLMPKGKTAGEYAVELREGSRLLERHETRSQEADAKLSGRPESVCKSRNFHHDIPAGPHRLTLVFSRGDYPEVAARCRISVLSRPEDFVAITPISYARIATVFVNDSRATYYAAIADRPVVFRVVGPARLKVVSRLVFDDRMLGSQKYTVSIFEGKKLFQRLPLETVRAVSQSFGDWPQVVPGKSRAFFIDVPAGEHHYNFGLSGGLAPGVAFLFALPKTALGNRENE